MKHRSYVVLPFLVVMVFVCAVVPGFSLATQPNISSYEPADYALQVWFDSTPQLTIAYPTFYEFNLAAMTSSGLWITSLHWDFGDGSTLNVPFSAESEVSDVRYHAYSQPGSYTVSVTAYDNMGNSGSAQVTVIWTTQTTSMNRAGWTQSMFQIPTLHALTFEAHQLSRRDQMHELSAVCCVATAVQESKFDSAS